MWWLVAFISAMLLTPAGHYPQTLLALPMWILLSLAFCSDALMKRKVAVGRRGQKARKRMNLGSVVHADFISADTVRLQRAALKHLRTIFVKNCGGGQACGGPGDEHGVGPGYPI